MSFRKLLPWLGLGSLATAFYAFIIPWTGFSDPDAFYHAKMSLLFWQHGPITRFPWLDLTLLGSHFADLHFLFHVIVSPFVATLGLYNGLRVATVLLSVVSILIFFACLRWLGVKYPLLWSAFLLVAQGYAVRALLGKATPLAMTLFLFGMTAAWKRKPWLVGVIAAVFALSYGGWPFLAGSVVLIAFGDALFTKSVENATWKHAVFSSRWKEVIAAWVGGFAGFLVHPNASQVFVFAWTQIVTIGLGTPFQHVALGNEWLPADPTGFIVTMSPWIMFAILGCTGLVLAIKKPLDLERARLLTAWAFVLAAFLALTLKSRRNIEYLVPVAALWCAVLWSLVDVKKFREEIFRFGFTRRYGLLLFGVCFVAVYAKQDWDLWKSLHPPVYGDTTAYAQSMAAISARAKPGDRVFHSSWDEFPILFVRDDRLRYMAGLDPTFLYVASSTLSDAYRDLTWDVTSSTPEQAWSLIHDQLNARFIFVSRKNHEKFLNLVQMDTRYTQIASSTDSAAFEVK